MVLFFVVLLALAVSLGLLIQGMHIVPHQQAWVIQRLGRFQRVLSSGLNWIIPGIDSVVYRHSLKEEPIEVPEQTAVTQDNVSVSLDGIVYVRIVDPCAASYGVKNPLLAVTQLVQTTMRSEIGKIPLDKTFEERESLNANIVETINEAAKAWGILCLRFEIKDIKIPEEIRKAMELQMTAERQKRAKILESEGLRQAQINLAEAAQIDRINRAGGDAEAIERLAASTARGLEQLAKVLEQNGGERAAALQLAEKYLDAFRLLAKENNTVIVPANLQHPAAMISEAMAIYGQVKSGQRVALPTEKISIP
jgi:regulator of protease activity HflC (stomatin/prohibitin superfamily)